MKRIGTVFLITLMLLTTIPMPLLADETVKVLHDTTITKVYEILTSNISEAQKAINEKAKSITVIIQNYKNKYHADIATVVTQYRKDYVLTKTTALEIMKNEYIDTMEKEKNGIVGDIEKQLKQSIDTNYQDAVKKILEAAK